LSRFAAAAALRITVEQNTDVDLVL